MTRGERSLATGRTVSPVDVNGPVGRVVQKVVGSDAFAPIAERPAWNRHVEMSGRDLRVFRLIPQEVPQ